MNEQELRKRLALLRSEHRDLDVAIAALTEAGDQNGFTDQLQMASNKQMRPILRQRPEIEAALEKRKVFTPEPGSTNP